MPKKPEISLECVLRLLIDKLTDEVNETLDSDDWAFVKAQGPLPKAYAAAALRHCMVLLEDIYHAGQEDKETTSRILSRVHFESWLVGMYLALGEDEALDALAADYLVKITGWKNHIDEYNKAVVQKKKTIVKRNKSIRANNEHKAMRNALYSEQPPLSILDEIPLPGKDLLQFPIDKILEGAQTDVSPKDLVLSSVATRVDQLLELAGSDLTVEAIYIVAYRSLSTFVSHPSLPVFDSYLSRDDRFFLRINKDSNQNTERHAFTKSALHMTAILTHLVLKLRGSKCPVAEYIDSLLRP